MFSSGAKIFGHVSHSTELVRMCLACQHFDFNSADWIFDNLHVISSWYLRTMGKEFIFRFSRRSWGRNAWRTPKNFCVGGYPEDGFLGGEMRYRISRSIAKSEVRISKSKSGFPNRTQPWSKKIIGCAWSFILVEVIKKNLLVLKYLLAYLGSSEKTTTVS